ncbi:hypothetical protein [Azospirillum sp. TSO35-2]|uniref:hypothetical protein n=1 Tax=Azospirillum sp. TSO35-2 TaxID=716796 RepID=UPI0011B6BAAB|nr:hypothetical protein [Azospirillum sp. TSO35-2]
MDTLYCACCGRPFLRASSRGPAPLYCSRDCRLQIAVRRRAWTALENASARHAEPPAEPTVIHWSRAAGGRRALGQRA